MFVCFSFFFFVYFFLLRVLDKADYAAFESKVNSTIVSVSLHNYETNFALRDGTTQINSGTVVPPNFNYLLDDAHGA